jgi:nicotinate-nucleotide--dimethylbenzimidazole phosphoribosyltransferase
VGPASEHAAENASGLPFSDIWTLLSKLPAFNELEAVSASQRETKMVQPAADRGRLSDMAIWLSGWQGRPPTVRRPELCLFVGASAMAEASSQQRSLAAAKLQIVMLSSGGSAANCLAQSLSAGLRVFDLAVDEPGRLMSAEAAMTELACARAFAFGMEAVAANADLLCLAAFGPGSRDSAAAVALCLLGGTAHDWVAGSGQDMESGYHASLALLEGAKQLHSPTGVNPLELLRRCGSREMAAICGAIVAARTQNIPVIIDGFCATVAAAILASASPGAIDHCMLSGRDGSPAHDQLIQHLSLSPLLDMHISASDGTGALLAASIVRVAADLHADLPSAANIGSLMQDAAGNA